MINFAMLRTVIGRFLIVERHWYRRARLRGRAWLAYLAEGSPVRRMIERDIFEVTHVLLCPNACVGRY